MTLRLLDTHFPSLPEFFSMSVPTEEVERLVAEAAERDLFNPCPATRRKARIAKLLKDLERQRVRLHLRPDEDEEDINQFLSRAGFRLKDTHRRMNQIACSAFRSLRWPHTIDDHGCPTRTDWWECPKIDYS